MIRVENIKKIYSLGGKPITALNIEKFNIEEGDFISFVGPSGSGKSTFLNIIGLVDKPTEGEIYIEGERVLQSKNEKLEKFRRGTIGYVFQAFNLLPHLTAIENVILPLIPYRVKFDLSKRATEILTRVGLGDRLHHLPSQLSGGEQQRVAIARALINNPKVILADEPTGNLDTKMRDEIIELFKEINSQGFTVVVATHDPEVAGKTRSVVHLRDGVLSGIEVHKLD